MVATLALAGCARRPAEAPAAAPAAASTASPAPSPASSSSVSPGPAPVGTPGARIFIDPVTGEARAPTPAELAAATPERRSPAAVAVKIAPEVIVTPLPGGITEYSINGGVQVEETTCVQDDGRLGECTAAQKAALRAASRPEQQRPARQ